MKRVYSIDNVSIGDLIKYTDANHLHIGHVVKIENGEEKDNKGIEVYLVSSSNKELEISTEYYFYEISFYDGDSILNQEFDNDLHYIVENIGPKEDHPEYFL